MSDDKKETSCCKGFEQSACPCIDEKTGEKSCGPENKNCGGGENNCCAPKEP